MKRLLSCALIMTSVCASADDKTLKLYNWADYFAVDTLSKFTAETGIQVIYDVMDGSETLEAKMMAGGRGYDLIFPGDTVAERLMRAGSLQALDPAKLNAMGDIEPGLQKLRTHYVNSNNATVPYTWGTIGLTYNTQQIQQRLPNAPVNSLDLLFKPENAAKFADCGISLIDSPDEVLAVVLNYLGTNTHVVLVVYIPQSILNESILDRLIAKRWLRAGSWNVGWHARHVLHSTGNLCLG